MARLALLAEPARAVLRRLKCSGALISWQPHFVENDSHPSGLFGLRQ
jgi:hypothetical protein